ncbi:hypothetical protein C2S51_014247 [Perilla frutescens var. frutescens]|nr:hypothetical protein C2S51_014247 [Perilla frutescens var. frutescens]
MLLNNVCEVFNSTILEAREMTILTMLEWIREWLMVRFQKNRELASLKWKGRICPRIKKLLELNAEKVHECIPIKGNNTHYEIKCATGDQYLVDLDLRICSCRSWSLSGIPCTHAICALNHQKLNRDDYVHDFLTVETFKKSYAATIRGVNGAILWGESIYIPPLPPQMIKGKGKQVNARRKASDEKVEKLAKNKTKLRRKPSIIRCSGCESEGHNSVTCGRNKVMQNTSTISGKASCSSSGSRAPTILPPSTEISDELEGPEEPSQTLMPGPSMLQQLHQGKFKGQGPLILESQRKFISLSEI